MMGNVIRENYIRLMIIYLELVLHLAVMVTIKKMIYVCHVLLAVSFALNFNVLSVIRVLSKMILVSINRLVIYQIVKNVLILIQMFVMYVYQVII